MSLPDIFGDEWTQRAQTLAHTLNKNRGDTWTHDSFEALQNSEGISSGRTLSLSTPEDLRAGQAEVPHITPKQIEDQSLFTRLSGQLNMPKDNWSPDDYSKFFYKGERALQKQIYANNNLTVSQKDKLATGVISKMEGDFGPGFRAGKTTMQDVQSYMNSMEKIVGDYGKQTPSGFSDFSKQADAAEEQKARIVDRVNQSREAREARASAQQDTVLKNLDASEAARTGSGFKAAQAGFRDADTKDHLQDLKEETQIRQKAIRNGQDPEMASRLLEKKRNEADKQKTENRIAKSKAADEQAMRIVGRNPAEAMTDEQKLSIIQQFETNDRYAPKTASSGPTAMQQQVDKAANIGGHLSKEESAGIAAQFEKNARRYDVDNKMRTRSERNKRLKSGKGYDTSHDEKYGEFMRKMRREYQDGFAEANGLDKTKFEGYARKNASTLMSGQSKEIQSGFTDYLDRVRHARSNVSQAKARAQSSVERLRDARQNGTFESLKYQKGGKGFLSQKETESIMKKTSGRHGLFSRAKDAMAGAINKASFGHTNLRTNRAEEIRNKAAKGVMKNKEKMAKEQVKNADNLLGKINNYDADAIKAGQTRKGISLYGRKQHNAEQRAAKKAGKKGLGLKGKAGAVMGLLALGGVLGNMMGNHGEQSNAQMYNPNPQPQYYS